MGNSFGQILKIHTFGESHGPAVGVVIDGFPSAFKVDLEMIQKWLNRRRPGQSKITTARNEPDQLEVLSGLENDVSLGSPICMIVRNRDQKQEDYSSWSELYRPSHADFTYHQKYGIRARSGGGRSSARETVGRVIAGALAAQWLKEKVGIEVVAWVDSIGELKTNLHFENLTQKEVDNTIVRCPDPEVSQKMISLVQELKESGDSIGGTVGCVVKNVPIGLGSPVFDKLEADLAKAMMSIPATKGFEIGSGFAGTQQKGSQHNDLFIKNDLGQIKTQTNNAGGIQGGISNGMPIYFKVAFKPPSTIALPQTTYCEKGENQLLEVKGRHDPCVVPRAVPIVEAMTTLVLLDHYLRHQLFT